MQMKDKPNDLLLLAGKVLTLIGQGILALAGGVVTLAIPAVLVFQDKINAEIAEEFGANAASFPLLALAGVLLCVAVLMAIGFVFLGKLRAIISSVGEGDPFVPENADRLTVMAWLALAGQVLVIPLSGLALFFAKWADEVDHEGITIDAGFDIEGILMVIVLFILARVFKHGAAMRDDLEGTV